MSPPSGPAARGMSLWYLSYADDATDGFRGACVIEAVDLPGAAARARSLGISPGGQVLGVEWDDELVGYPCPFPLDKLMTLEELRALDQTVISRQEFEEETGMRVEIPHENVVEDYGADA